MNLIKDKKSLWAPEGSAAWMEYKLIREEYPEIEWLKSDGLKLFLRERIWAYLTEWQYEGIQTEVAGEEYRRALYWWFIENYTGIDFIKSFWMQMDHSKEPIKAIDDLTDNGFDDIFKEFAKANYFTDQYYPKDIKNIGVEGRARTTSVDLKTQDTVHFTIPTRGKLGLEKIQNYGAIYFEITDTRQDNEVQITFVNPDNEENFFLKIFPRGVKENEINVITPGTSHAITLGINAGEGTIVIVGRLGDDEGDGDFEIWFWDMTQILQEYEGMIQFLETIFYDAPIDSTVTEATFNLDWLGSDLDLTLISPDGDVITPEVAEIDPDITYVEESTHEHYTIKNPVPGMWTLNITGVDVPPEGENFTVSVTMKSDLGLDISTDKQRYDPGEPIIITADLLYNDTPIYGDVTAVIKKPDGEDIITLFDDGSHGDVSAGDGEYTNIYDNTSGEGVYEIIVNASGVINSTQFVRENKRLVKVQRIPDLKVESTGFSNSTPMADDIVNITVIVSNIGDAPAQNASILFYDRRNLIRVENANIGVNESIATSTVWQALPGEHNISVEVRHELDENLENNIRYETINVTAIKRLYLTCMTNKITYGLYENVLIQCSVEDYLGNPTSVNVSADVEFNGTLIESLNLINLTEDFTGLYSGVFNRTNVVGLYNVVINATTTKEGYINDTMPTSFEVIQMPDLTISNITLSDKHAVVGENVIVSATISNIGTESAENITVLIYANSSLIGNQTIAHLSVNESAYVSASWILDNDTKSATVIIDPENEIVESNEFNNNASVWFCGIKGDFDCNGVVDALDFVAFEDVYDTICEDSKYNATGDFEDDCDIDFVDFVRFTRAYEKNEMTLRMIAILILWTSLGLRGFKIKNENG